jgi:hypothetical protein
MSSEFPLLANTSQNVAIARAGVIPREAETVARPRGPIPVWRSLLSPWPGQRALVLGPLDSELFRLLQDSGVRVERDPPASRAEGDGVFDLILEERPGWGSRLRGASVPSLLTAGGRWITVVHGHPVVGIRGGWVRSQIRRQGFEQIETFYAHSMLWSPQFLVPLERLEPFEFFLRLTVGGRASRRRAILSAYQLFGRLRIHRGFLPNCIVVARRSR